MSRRDIVEARHIDLKLEDYVEKLIKKYVPMTETAFYILLSLTEPRHGYGIIKRVEELTDRSASTWFRHNLWHVDKNAKGFNDHCFCG